MSSQPHPEPIGKSEKRQSEVPGENEEIPNARREKGLPQERKQQLPLGESGMACGSASLGDPGDQ